MLFSELADCSNLKTQKRKTQSYEQFHVSAAGCDLR